LHPAASPPFPNLLLIHPTRKEKKEKFCYLVVVVDILAGNVYFSVFPGRL
jgi:hypothetical protein